MNDNNNINNSNNSFNRYTFRDSDGSYLVIVKLKWMEVL